MGKKYLKGNLAFLTLSILGVILLNIPLILSAIVGVSPPEINFKNVLRNGYAERGLVISIDSEKPVNVQISSRGEISNWLNFSDNNFSVSKNNPVLIKVSVSPPADIPNGNYSGFLTISTSGFGEGIEGQAVGIIRSAVEPYVTVQVSDVEIKDCFASDFKVESVEKGDDIVFNLKISNNGNIKLKPRAIINIWDQDQISMLKSQDFIGQEILPTLDRDYIFRISSSDLNVGQYFAEISVPDCYSSQTLTFDILEPGALRANGVITSIVVPKIVKLGETIKIIVIFRNIGEKEVEARFKGQITREGKIYQILESEKFKVPAGETNNFDFYFTPKKTGKYVILGRVYYSNKKTFESSSSFDVISEKGFYNLKIINFIVPIIYAFLIFLIVILFYKINKERRSYLNKFKNLTIK
ncbi:MAG: hypothetical protein QXW97_00035 [Candidatus Pacearchaeota archaeon]